MWLDSVLMVKFACLACSSTCIVRLLRHGMASASLCLCPFLALYTVVTAKRLRWLGRRHFSSTL